MNILILTGKFGMGHLSAANSLKEEILEKYPNANVTLMDMIDYVAPQQAPRIYKSFGFMAKKGSIFYNQIYKQSENKGCLEPPLLYGYFIRRLKTLLEEAQPNVIFSTLPLCSQVLAKYKRRLGGNWQLVTCITDISSHGEWINEEVDYYLVAAEPVKQELVRKGVPEAQILITGIPVRKEFQQDRQQLEAAPRQGATDQGSLAPDRAFRQLQQKRKILIMGGGLGLLPESPSFYEALNRLEQAEFTVITGRNERLFTMLKGRYEHIEVLGYTDRVADYMKAADAVITKPGGITVFEAIAAETPLLLFAPFLQQEKTNGAFVREMEIGRILPKAEGDMLRQLRLTLADEGCIVRYQENMHRLKASLDRTAMARIFQAASDTVAETANLPYEAAAPECARHSVGEVSLWA